MVMYFCRSCMVSVILLHLLGAGARGPDGSVLWRAGRAEEQLHLLHQLEVCPSGELWVEDRARCGRHGGGEERGGMAGRRRHAARSVRTSDMPHGIRLVAQKAEKVPFQPGQLAAQVFDQGKYKAWYTIDPCDAPEPFSTKDKILPGHNAHICYAESDDAVTWKVPQLGLYEYAGTKDNNIVFRGDLNGSTRGFHGGSVFVDPSSDEERYKMIYLGIITDEEWDAFAAKYPDEVDTMARRTDVGGFRCVVAVFGAVSPDGIHWQSLPEPLMIQHADTLNTCYYDVDRKKYVAYVRAWQVNPKAPGTEAENIDSWIGVGRRSIGRAVSSDFRHFGKVEIVVSTGADMPPSHLFYTNGKTTLPDIPDNHVMFPWIWELECDGGSTWLMSSADGVSWAKVPGGPVVETGLPGPATAGTSWPAETCWSIRQSMGHHLRRQPDSTQIPRT